MEKISDYQILQIAYDYQHNKKDFLNATIWLHKLITGCQNSEYVGVAKQRVKEMGIPLELAAKEILKIEAANKEF